MVGIHGKIPPRVRTAAEPSVCRHWANVRTFQDATMTGGNAQHLEPEAGVLKVRQCV